MIKVAKRLIFHSLWCLFKFKTQSGFVIYSYLVQELMECLQSFIPEEFCPSGWEQPKAFPNSLSAVSNRECHISNFQGHFEAPLWKVSKQLQVSTLLVNPSIFLKCIHSSLRCDASQIGYNKMSNKYTEIREENIRDFIKQNDYWAINFTLKIALYIPCKKV